MAVNVKKACGFEIIVVNEFFRESTWIKGSKLYNSRHVDKLIESIENGKDYTEVTGVCLPETSIRNKPYEIVIQVNMI